MEYTVGVPGRVVLARIDHGEELLGALTTLAEREKIETALVLVLGALASGEMAQGPTSLTLPPVPLFSGFADGRELLGVGTLLTEDERAVLHLHGATGRAGATAIGCLRGEARVYATVEVVLLELALEAARRAESGLSRLVFET